jgi:Sugar (and other) transporter
MKGRDEEAKVVLQRLHDDHSDSFFWEKEYVQIHAQLQKDREELQGASWLEMFSNPVQRKRTLVSVMTMVMVQTTGAQTIQVFQVRAFLFSVNEILIFSRVFFMVSLATLRAGRC